MCRQQGHEGWKFLASWSAILLVCFSTGTYNPEMLLTKTNGAGALHIATCLEWGAATSAYQIEGAINADGRGKDIWTPWVKFPFRILDGSNAETAVDFYHRYQEDIDIMKQLGTQHFRMSISWVRIFPQGSGKVNLDGLAFYHKVLDALIAAKIKPQVTLYHWDMPQALQDKYGGLSNYTAFTPDFVNYVRTVVQSFGDKLKYYPCIHTILRAHAAASKAIRAINPKAKIGIALYQDWPEPLSNNPDDIEAAERYWEFQAGIYADPIFKGDYPASVKLRVPSSILPRITPELRKDLLGSADYYAMNHYTAIWVWYQPFALGLYSQAFTNYLASYVAPNGTLIGPPTASSWAFSTPWAFRKMLNFVNNRYKPKEIIVTEQGVGLASEKTEQPISQALRDVGRIAFFQSYLQNLSGSRQLKTTINRAPCKSVSHCSRLDIMYSRTSSPPFSAANDAITQDGVPLTKLFVWSLMDNWEWNAGYTVRLGITYIDYKNNLTRYMKDSALWLANYFGTLPDTGATALPDNTAPKRSRTPYSGGERAGWGRFSAVVTQ